MKTNKALKRLTKIEALMADVTDRYSTGASHIQEALQHAKAAVVRAKDVVSLHVSAVANAAVVAAKVARGGKQAAAPARKTAKAKKRGAKVPTVKTAKESTPIKKRAKKAVTKTAPKSSANKKVAKKKTAVKKTAGSGVAATPEIAAQ